MVDWLQDVQNRLHVVSAICHGAGVSLWGCRGASLDLLLGRPGETPQLWPGVRPALSEGRVVVRAGVTLIPLRSSRRLTGVLAVAGPVPADTLSHSYLDTLVRLLGGQLGRPVTARQPPPTVRGGTEGRAPRGPAPSVSAEGLKRLIEQARGNIALVADWSGVSRQTVYNWLHSFGLPRPPRGARRD